MVAQAARGRSAERINETPRGRETSTEKRAREQKLQALLKEFRSTAERGIRVDLVHPESELMSQTIFKMDSGMGSMSLQPAFAEESRWELCDIGAVMKGNEFIRRVPKLAHLSSNCLGIEFESEMQIRCLHFPEASVRDDFHACLKILRMCADKVGGA